MHSDSFRCACLIGEVFIFIQGQDHKILFDIVSFWPNFFTFELITVCMHNKTVCMHNKSIITTYNIIMLI